MSGNSDRRTLVDAHLYLLTTMALFGSAFASSKVVVDSVPHEIAAALRFGGGAIILLAISATLRRRPGSFSWRDAVRAGLVGLLGVFGYNVFFFWGLSLAPSIDGSVIVPVLSPVITTGFMVATRRERASAARLGGLLLGLGGAAVFFVGAGATLNGGRLLGDLVYLLGAGAWAAYTITSKRVLSRIDPLRATTAATAVGAFALVLFAIPAAVHYDWADTSRLVWGNVLYLAIGPTAIAYLFFYRGLRSVGPSTATVMMFAVPVFGITFAVVFLGESFHAMQIIGAVVMLVGALIAVSEQVVRTGRSPASAPSSGNEQRETLPSTGLTTEISDRSPAAEPETRPGQESLPDVRTGLE